MKWMAEPNAVALIEMPPYATVDQQIISPLSHAVLGKLSDSREWFAQTPLQVELLDGKVIAVAERSTDNPE